MVAFLRNAGVYAAAGAAPTVQPTIIRAAELGSLSGGPTGGNWSSSGSFNAAGTEPNRLLLVFLLWMDNQGGSVGVVNSLTIGGTAGTLGKGPIAPTDGSGRAFNTAGYYRVAPANSGSLSVAWDIAGANATTCAKVYGALLRDVHQSNPLPNFGQVADSNDAAQTFIDVPLTAGFSSSLLLGAFMSRGADTTHSARGGSTIAVQGQTGISLSLDIDCSVASLAGGGPGAKTLGVTLASGDDRGGLAFEVRAA